MTAHPKPTPRVKVPTRLRRRKTLGRVRAERKAAGAGVDPDTWRAILRWYLESSPDDVFFVCAYCRPGECSGRIVQDHVVPLAKGGRHEPSNVVPACERANFTKGTQRWTPARMHPFRTPDQQEATA